MNHSRRDYNECESITEEELRDPFHAVKLSNTSYVENSRMAAIELPAMRSAEKAVMAACA